MDLRERRGQIAAEAIGVGVGLAGRVAGQAGEQNGRNVTPRGGGVGRDHRGRAHRRRAQQLEHANFPIDGVVGVIDVPPSARPAS